MTYCSSSILPTVVPPSLILLSILPPSFYQSSIFHAFSPSSFHSPTRPHHPSILASITTSPSLFAPLQRLPSLQYTSICFFAVQLSYFILSFPNITEPFTLMHTHSRSNKAGETTKHLPTDDSRLYKCLAEFLDICCLFSLFLCTDSGMYKDWEIDVNCSNPYLLTLSELVFFSSSKSVEKIRTIQTNAPIVTSALL